jgi:hypothetical protein
MVAQRHAGRSAVPALSPCPRKDFVVISLSIGETAMNVMIAGLLACGCVSLIDAPLWPPASDYLDVALKCSQSSNAASCEKTRQSWTGNFNEAIAGKNKAQRFVAYCLITGCDGAIKTNAVLGCAWGQVAMATAPREADDTASLQQYCDRPYLDEAGEHAADAEAQSLRQMLSVK